MSKIRYLPESETDELSEQIRKRNVFARHSWENNFYLQRVQELADHTVIEVYRTGDPRAVTDEVEKTANIIEKITILSSTLIFKKPDLHRKLGIGERGNTEISFIIGPEFRFLRSRTKSLPKSQGVMIDEAFVKRFTRCGFDNLFTCLIAGNDISKRISRSTQWLIESRLEPQITASVVKTSIALESLLVFSESESLGQSLSERAAFILTADPGERQLISRFLKRFYDVRSGVVHGSEQKMRKLTYRLLETTDRIAILLYLAIASNLQIWSSVDSIREWCESQRWGSPWSDINIPYPKTYLKNIIVAAQEELGSQNLKSKNK